MTSFDLRPLSEEYSLIIRVTGAGGGDRRYSRASSFYEYRQIVSLFTTRKSFKYMQIFCTSNLRSDFLNLQFKYLLITLTLYSGLIVI